MLLNTCGTRRQVAPGTLHELVQALVQEWRSIPQRFILNYLVSMRQRCIHVVRAIGGHTRDHPGRASKSGHMDSVEGASGLLSLIKNLRTPEIANILNSEQKPEELLSNVPVYHILVESLLHKQSNDSLNSDEYAKAAIKLVYLLSIHGADLNIQDENGDTALLCYLKTDLIYLLSDALVVALLRCGTDSCLKNKEGLDILQQILQRDDLPKQIRARVLEYMPGIWRAVDSDDACTVRRLINQWCNIRVIKDGMSVLQLAYSKGTENIIRVISGIGPSMDMAHSVLAGDSVTVRKMLQSNNHVNVNLKNMAEMAATPLFYAMCNNDRDMVELLLRHGARLDSGMQGENEMELPLYFAALSHKPNVDTDMLRYTIPKRPVPVDHLNYKGRNVIFYCIEHEVDIDLFSDILRSCSAHVLTQRIEGNINAREYAVLLCRGQYVTKIDVVVSDWCTQEDQSINRNTLCLHGYPYVLPLTSEDTIPNEKFINYMHIAEELEEYKYKLREATIEGDATLVKEMLATSTWSDKGLNICLADCRVCGDGQPLLHKAVLWGHDDVVKEIVQYVIQHSNRKLDSFRDQYFRTALHYLYGMECYKLMADVLEDSGMSEFSMDKEGRSPLAFKDRRGLLEMKALIEYHQRQDFTDPEPDPWSVSLPMPITGYLKQCLHEHHMRKKHEKYDVIENGKQISKSKHNKKHHNSKEVSKMQKSIYKGNGNHAHDLKCNRNEICNSTTESVQFDINKVSANVEQYPGKVDKKSISMGDKSREYQKVDTVVSMKCENGNYYSSNVYRENDFTSLRSYDSETVSTEDISDLSSACGSLYEDYEGDQSDVESEDMETSQPDKYCTIL